MAPVAEDVAAVHNGTVIKLIFLKTGKSRILSPLQCRPGRPALDATSRKVHNMFLELGKRTQISFKRRDDTGIKGGVGVIAGNDDFSVLAWSDAGPTPNVHVYQYLLPSQVIDLKGKVSRTLDTVPPNIATT